MIVTLINIINNVHSKEQLDKVNFTVKYKFKYTVLLEF